MLYQNEILGGLLIGIASALPLLFDGRIAGVSGYAASALKPKSKEGKTGLLFVVGLVIGGIIWRFSGGRFSDSGLAKLSFLEWAIAGLLVGFGSRLSGGCTSGHGVCGIGRMSPRSFAAVLIFMSIAILTNFVLRSYL